ncbi:hypothetical protein GUJ93_ZPchr0001g32566 [Zizania palustris]|uniref:CSC1/OSCA1-like 7TM region domain-containing protein n=1 Tax=Zizania palustris TaxID=103762 RepID=A0A8J5R6Z4_ZIZPA|nr:hypothetical protein GUJ93_ZPchr0001g32566 [Zizania palustris]
MLSADHFPPASSSITDADVTVEVVTSPEGRRRRGRIGEEISDDKPPAAAEKSSATADEAAVLGKVRIRLSTLEIGKDLILPTIFLYMFLIGFEDDLIIAVGKGDPAVVMADYGFRIPRTIRVAIPMKATFFMTYIMVDGWASIANEILQVKPLVINHLKNTFNVKTERGREKAMDPSSIGLAEAREPSILAAVFPSWAVGLVYAVITPILLPFIIIIFALPC